MIEFNQRRSALQDELRSLDNIKARQKEIIEQSDRLNSSYKNNKKELEDHTKLMEKIGSSLGKNLQQFSNGNFGGFLGEIVGSLSNSGGILGGVANVAQVFLSGSGSGIGGKMGGGINMFMNIATPDIGGFRQSQGQVMADAFQSLNRGQRNL